MDISGTIVKFPLFKDYESKEKFFTVLGMLYSRQITLSKASELLDIAGFYSKLPIEFRD